MPQSPITLPAMARRPASLAGMLFVLLSSSLFAAGISIGSGSSMSLGSGTVDLGCGNLAIASGGTLSGDQGTLRLAGNWSGGSGFSPGTSHVSIVDGCATPETSMVSGNNTFFNLSAQTNDGKTLVFDAGSVQTIQNSVSLSGSNGNLLTIRSTSPGSAADLDLAPGGTQVVDYVDVADNHATGQPLAPGPPIAYHSIDSGNTTGWFITATSIPALGSLGFAILLALLGFLGLRALRRRSESASP
ncbi:MAG TPA: hypothetical protein VKA53_03370 [Thermoanaerobaculia bacterium]|nr:hypothetical protein [Thermoanaerobaculia bacterium]